MVPALNLVVDGVVEDEVHLCLNLLKMAQLTNLVSLVELVLCLPKVYANPH